MIYENALCAPKFVNPSYTGRAILAASVDLPRGEKKNVSTLIKESGPDVSAALNRIGVKRVAKRNSGDEVLWIHPNAVVRTILKQTEYEHHTIEQYLERFDGAKRSRQRLGGEETFWGIEIPLETVWTHFHQSDDNE